ncbi:MAG: hypothetical protein IPO60_05295 [Flavobacteriales bacterium]|nr:hypothetical protein [Flavobacteriales bacterium]
MPTSTSPVWSQSWSAATPSTCEANCIYGTFPNTWYVDGVPTALPDGLLQSYTGSGGCSQSGVTDTYQPVFGGCS